MIWGLLALVAVGMGAGVWLFMRGVERAERDLMEADLDDVDRANRVRRDVEREPDPGKRLLDFWRR